MGACPSEEQNQEEVIISKTIEKQIKVERMDQKYQRKILLLGSGESGKSTFFKQMKILSNESFTDEFRTHMRRVIILNCFNQIRALLIAFSKSNQEFVNPETKKSADFLLNCVSLEITIGSPSYEESRDPYDGGKEVRSVTLTPEIVNAIQICWTDKRLQHTYYSRGIHYQLNDSTPYFFETIEKYLDEQYIPTDEDILHARVKTTGVVEAKFTVKDFSFRLIDVGGQKSERRKWLHCFDNVTSVFYFVSLNEYDMNCREDSSSNRMQDSLALFEGVCNSPWFLRICFVLFLNKVDLFREKINNVDLKVCFPRYIGGCDYDKGIEYIRKQFNNANKSPHEVFQHLLVAIDTKNVDIVFETVRKAIISQSLKNAGLIG